MATIVRLKSGSWRAQIRRRKVACENKTFADESSARLWAATREAELVSAHVAAMPKVVDALSFAAVVGLYFESPRFKSKAPGTQLTERTKAKPVIKYFENRSILTIDPPAIQEYFDTRASYQTCRGKPLSGHSLRLEKALLSGVFKYARLRRYVPQNPMLDTYEMLPCNSREVRIQQKDEAALDEVAILWSRLKRTNKSFLPWLQFVRGTGSRPGESARIRLDWLNLAESKIDMPRSGQKKRNPRLIILGPALVEVLRKQLALARQAGSAYLFWSVNPRTKQPVPFAYHKPWARVCKYAGLSNLGGAHSMRHEFISRLYEHTELTDGMIAALVGDVNPLSLAPYRHLRVAALRDKSAEHMVQMAALYAVAQRQLTKQREVVEGDDDWLLEPVSISLKDL
jgi:integrase